MKYKTLYTLFTTFFKIGLLTFGGGYSMLPFIEKEMTEKNKFITQDELLDIFSISECTPGPVSINCATFIGYKLCGFIGAIISTLGIVLPSFIIILLISFFLDFFKNFQIISSFLSGIKIGVIVMLLFTVLKMNKKSQKNKYYYPIVLMVLILCSFTSISSITILIISIVINVLILTFRRKF
ncbi:chromate transporter [Candidatus Arthromitus sp. SFB-rat-Yit]|uniref:chromate transporter n=1 Tax=Candidatus Arthromitus sp. SFB-rat-Yit TaxID=1041504 RepID=UPI000227A62C|nr:chromate transporter [Candidatus Arthromitus sp. SFB-rat-Yit]BAK80586.1 chromate transport protein [Candidatus Arthromitus sp. SFB-rat-Yit]